MGLGVVNVDVGGVIDGVGNLAKTIKTLITGKVDPGIIAQIDLKVLEIEADINKAQSGINQVEAGNSSFFVAGWRPLIGWMGGVAIGMQYILRPLVSWVGAIIGVTIPFPEFDLSQLWPLITGMLGIAGMRSYEKAKGLTK